MMMLCRSRRAGPFPWMAAAGVLAAAGLMVSAAAGAGDNAVPRSGDWRSHGRSAVQTAAATPESSVAQTATTATPGDMGGTSGWVSVRRYLPAGWSASDGMDLRPVLQQALDEQAMLFFPGSNDPDRPVVYSVTAGLQVRPRSRIRFGANAWLRRLPSSGKLLTLGDEVHINGAVIDGSKYDHWPAFRDLGKGDAALVLGSHCVVEDVVVFNSPGIAFMTYGDGNRLYRCRAENAGYIDLRFGALFYQGAWDRWSGDGFYLRGTGNLVRDSHAYDCFRWDLCSSHSGARSNTYVDCRGGDARLRTYGFVDIEGAEGGNRLIRCISPNSPIAIPGSPGTQLIRCTASRISVYDRENPNSVDAYGGRCLAPRITGCTTTAGGIVVGGWSSGRGELVPGAAAPIVTGNVMYRTRPGPSDRYSDFSFSVTSTDGHGLVAENILFEYDDGEKRGPGMDLRNVATRDNQVVYGQWQPEVPLPRLLYAEADTAKIAAAQQAYGRELLDGELEAAGLEAAKIRWIEGPVAFSTDPQDHGTEAGWPSSVPANTRAMPLGRHWDHVIGRYHGVAWYFIRIGDTDLPAKGRLHIFLGGVDSHARVWLDGRLVGEHDSWNRPSLLAVKERPENRGAHLLVLRVSTPTGMGGVYGPVALVAAGAR